MSLFYWKRADGRSDCLRIRVLMLSTGNKRVERGWQVLWVKCLITVRFWKKKKEKRNVSLIIRVGCDAINTTVTIICIFTTYLFDDLLVRSCACSAGFEPWSFMVDRRVADSYASQFLPDYMGGVLHGYDLHTHVRSKNQLTCPC